MYAWRHFRIEVFVVLEVLLTRAFGEICHSQQFHAVRGSEKDDYLFYGLTQDCQMFFIRPSQLSLLSTIKVNPHSSYCYPNLVQLHVQTPTSLLLVIKQAGNRICTLDVQIPSPDMLFGDHIFSYTLLSALQYSVCSHSPNNAFNLDPDLSFMDSVYKDVIYFIDSKSEGELWSIHQFQILPEGPLKYLDRIAVNNHNRVSWNIPSIASEYIVGLDSQKNYLYQRNRYSPNYLYECAFDLMFRPESVVVHYANTTEKPHRTWLNSVSADRNFLLFSESDRSARRAITRVYAQNVSTQSMPYCIVSAEFSFEIGVIRLSTIEEMHKHPLPNFDASRPYQPSPPPFAGRVPSTTTHRSTTEKVTLKSTTVKIRTPLTLMSSVQFEPWKSTTPRYQTTRTGRPSTMTPSTEQNAIDADEGIVHCKNLDSSAESQAGAVFFKRREDDEDIDEKADLKVEGAGTHPKMLATDSTEITDTVIRGSSSPTFQPSDTEETGDSKVGSLFGVILPLVIWFTVFYQL